MSPLDPVMAAFAAAKARYDSGVNDPPGLGGIASAALALLLAPGTDIVAQGTSRFDGREKRYEVRRLRSQLSRPIRDDLFIADPAAFAAEWDSLVRGIDSANLRIAHPSVDAVVYTAVISFAAAIDLYSPGSRKTPGTFLEILTGTLLGAVTQLPRGKQIALPGVTEKVTTDIVLTGGGGRPNLVVPTKITSRERVVQPFAHQRILDDAYGRGAYRSVFMLVSELQRDAGVGVKEICVPGQIKLYQQYLGRIYGMYYLDPPAAYQTPSFLGFMPTKPFSALVGGDLTALLAP